MHRSAVHLRLLSFKFKPPHLALSHVSKNKSHFPKTFVAVDLKDLQHEAKIIGLKIPQATLDEMVANERSGRETSKKSMLDEKQTPPKSSRGRRLTKTAVVQLEGSQAPPDPRMKKV